MIRQVELETTDNESDYGKEVDPDWEFESTSLEESAGGGWEMVGILILLNIQLEVKKFSDSAGTPGLSTPVADA